MSHSRYAVPRPTLRYTALLDEAQIAFVLSPMVSKPPEHFGGRESNYDALTAAVLEAKAGGEQSEILAAYRPLYLGSISNVNAKILDLSVPSLSVPTSAKHHVDGHAFPAGVLLWGSVRGDRQLLAYGAALEVALAK